MALDEAVAIIPKDAVESVNNNAGAQLAARRIAYIFPYFAKADWVIVDQKHPFFYDKEDEKMHSLALGRLVLDTNFRSVYAKDGVYVFKRIDAGDGTADARRRNAVARSDSVTGLVRESLTAPPPPLLRRRPRHRPSGYRHAPSQATQLNTANLAVNPMSRSTPTATTTLCSRGRSRV